VTETAAGSQPAAGLSARLRDRLRPLRDGAPPVFLRLLLAGALEPAEYAELLAQYRLVYTALDRAAAISGDDPVATRYAEHYRDRVLALEHDLRTLLGTAAPDVEVCDAAVAYRDRILKAAARPGGFAAHHHVRYLADLSGGQLIQDALEEAYGLDSAELRFHSFPGPFSVRTLKEEYRAVLDATVRPEAEQRLVVDEAVVAYGLSTGVLDEMGARLTRDWSAGPARK
jgi:heme oxygenase